MYIFIVKGLTVSLAQCLTLAHRKQSRSDEAGQTPCQTAAAMALC